MRARTKFLVTLISLAAMLAVVPIAVDAQDHSDQVRNLVNRGNTMLRTRHYQEAIQAYDEALKLDSGCAVAKSNIALAHNNWGISFFSQKRYKEALNEFEKCLSLSPNDTNAKRNIGILNQVVSQQGIDLDADPAAAEGDGAPDSSGAHKAPGTVATWDPLTGQPIKATRKPPAHPVGAAGDSGAAAVVGKSEPHNDPIGEQAASGGAVMLTPGIKMSADSGDAFNTGTHFELGGTSPVTPATRTQAAPPIATYTQPEVPPPTSNYSSGASLISPNQASSAATIVPPPREAGSNEGVNFVTPQLPPPSSSGPAAQNPTPPRATAPPTSLAAPTQLAPPTSLATPATASPTTSAPSGSSSVDDQLSAVETKMYGQTQSSLTVMQRLEKMEREVSGQTRTGSILDRINYLKQNIGM